jgi:cytochrome c
MFMSRFALRLSIVLMLSASAAHAQNLSPAAPLSPQLGKAASGELVAAWDMTILPSGDGLPQGSGTTETGARLYLEHCVACHGEGGVGGLNNVLVSDEPRPFGETGGKRTVGNYWPYATTLFDYIRRAMPYSHPQSLDDNEVYALTAYLLYRNGVVPAHFEANASALPKVVMPNQEYFIRAYPDWNP